MPFRFGLAPVGVVAQLVERLNGIQEVRGSNPLGSTSIYKGFLTVSKDSRGPFVTSWSLFGANGTMFCNVQTKSTAGLAHKLPESNSDMPHAIPTRKVIGGAQSRTPTFDLKAFPLTRWALLIRKINVKNNAANFSLCQSGQRHIADPQKKRWPAQKQKWTKP
jgi:hypothetical protein